MEHSAEGVIDDPGLAPFGRHSRGENILLLLVLLTVLVGVLAYIAINRARESGHAATSARFEVGDLLELTLDQETGVRGYIQTREPVFLQPYRDAGRRYPAALERLQADSAHAPAAARADVAAFAALHARWETTVLQPLLSTRDAHARSRLLFAGKQLVDAMRARAADAQQVLLARTDAISAGISRAIILSVGSIVFMTIVLGAVALAIERKRFAQEQELRAELAVRNAELERSNKSLEQFAYVASHDLQEPLRTVANFTQLLQQRYAGRLDAQAEEFIGYAVDGARRMRVLIDDILTYSRVSTRGGALVPIALRLPLDRALEDLRATIADRRATIEIGELPDVIGDATQLEQLFVNLIVNGLKYNRSAIPHIAIDAKPAADLLVVRVRDNGIGIASEYHDRIFVIFSRLHARGEYEGTGIGLALCQRIVERHGGRIWVESVEGCGSTFLFTLPLPKEL